MAPSRTFFLLKVSTSAAKAGHWHCETSQKFVASSIQLNVEQSFSRLSLFPGPRKQRSHSSAEKLGKLLIKIDIVRRGQGEMGFFIPPNIFKLEVN